MAQAEKFVEGRQSMEQELVEILIFLNGIDISKKKEAKEALFDGAAKLTALANQLSKMIK
ncbi:hypothetical protein FC85_GL002751 [Lentilactobacillus diolivorans DSM 14421]|uniref:Uncharacterized protein n=2 Tax=Lentilactobacillus diolivorans TaxID=179838 RepID=A0A0R1SDD2_9LACO|nr:hypothetical protein FC85_GL002751 [Lentilactobacillus diolivorans DSM 14421]